MHDHLKMLKCKNQLVFLFIRKIQFWPCITDTNKQWLLIYFREQFPRFYSALMIMDWLGLIINIWNHLHVWYLHACSAVWHLLCIVRGYPFSCQVFIVWRDLMIPHHNYHHLLWVLFWWELGWSGCLLLNMIETVRGPVHGRIWKLLQLHKSCFEVSCSNFN